MSLTRLPTDLLVSGNLAATSMNLPSGSVSNAQVTSNAAIDAAKVNHAKQAGTDGGLGLAGTFDPKHVIVFVATSAATIHKFQAVLNGACTTGTAGFDLNINGSTALSAHVTFTSADAAKLVKAGTLSSTVLAAGDIVSIEFTDDSGTPDGTGPFAWVEIEEALAS